MKTVQFFVVAPVLALAGLAAVPESAAAQCCLNPTVHTHGELTAANLPDTSLFLNGSGNADPFQIVIVPGDGLAANTAALDAFQRAANRWAQYFTDPITVTINADLRTEGLPPAALGGADPVTLAGGYTLVRNQMVLDSLDEPDDGIVAALPTINEVSIWKPTALELSGNLSMTKANAKALGFTDLDATFGTSDGDIVFNSAFNFDFDNSDGVGEGLIDFETVAAHEIGHVLGFLSEVDTVDLLLAMLSSDPDANVPAVDIGVLDMFRFRDGIDGFDPSTPEEFTTFARSLVPDEAAVLDDLANEWRMSEGFFFGDGRQASHWLDDALSGILIGMMDPTLASGGEDFPAIHPLTYADLRALDLIGYDVVPEPGAVGLVLLAGLAMRRRRVN